VGKQHFTLLYSRARSIAFTSRNIQSGWSKTGLFPFNPDRVLDGMQKPQTEESVPPPASLTTHLPPHDDMLPTPVTFESLRSLRTKIAQDTTLDHSGQHRFQKLANAAEKAFADRALLLDENRLLFEQNNKKTTRLSIRSTVTGTAKVMAYDDIIEAQRKRDAKEAIMPGTKRRNRKCQRSKTVERERSRAEESEAGWSDAPNEMTFT
jgi:hypothetical protein